MKTHRRTTWARRIIQGLDRPGGRWLLSRYATWHARRTSRRDIEVFHDGVWMHRIDQRSFADSETFVYTRRITPKWLLCSAQQDAWVRDFWFHEYSPRPGDVIVDIGAGTGTDLPEFSRAVGPHGRVVAVEAHPVTFRLMEQAIANNGLPNVRPIQAAIVDNPGPVTISDGDQHLSNSLLDSTDEGFEVQGCTLKDICETADIGRIDLLKMNIEGAERFAIHGMTDVLENVRHVCIACHDHRADRGDGEMFRTEDLVVDYLTEQGFSVSRRTDDSRPYVRHHVHGRNPKFESASATASASVGECR